MRITVGDNAKILFDRPINDDRWLVIEESFIRLMNITPGQKIPLLFSSWNPEAKKLEHDWVMTLVKDDKQCFSVTVEWDKGGKYVFPIKGPWNTTIGSDPMGDNEASLYGLKALIKYIKYTSPVQMVMSNDKAYWTKMRSGGGFSRGGGGRSNYQRQQGSGGGGGGKSQDDDNSNYFKGD